MESANRPQNPLSSDQVPVTAFIQPNPVLKCVGGALNGKSYPISDTLCIGTNAAFCNVLYPEGEPGVCGIHCKITAADGQTQLTDIDSAGTFINGVPILPNVPYTMPIGSSFYVGSPNNVFIIAENAPSAGTPAPFVNTENTARPKKRFPWIAIVSAAAVIAVVILFLLFGKNRDTYTGVTGKGFAIPNVGFANIVFDGKEQTVGADYKIRNGMFNRSMGLYIGEAQISWIFATSAVSWEAGASFDLVDFRDDDKCFVGLFQVFDNTEALVSYRDTELFEGFEYFDEANLTVLELDGDELTFYFYLKLSYDGESHTLEGVGHAMLTEYPA